MMFNILDFIDSKDIREYNRDTQFTPIEQAVLIYYSRGTTIEEKIAAWKDLLAIYSEGIFEIKQFISGEITRITIRQILTETIAIYENTLAQRKRTDGVVFEAVFYESDFPDNRDAYYFPDYNSALAYIEKEKKYYLDDEDLCKCNTQARIAIKEFDTRPGSDSVFYFDNKMRIINLSPGDCVLSDKEFLISDLYIYVPLPFKKGDILRSITPGIIDYGTLPKTPDKEYYARAIDHGDSSDMIFTLDTFESNGEFGCFSYGHFFPLDFEKCPVDELPENLSILRFISEVHTGELSFSDFICYYSQHGEKAYQKLYRYS